MRLSDPIPAYRGASGADWYNSMRADFAGREGSITDEEIYDYMYPLASYVAAVTFDRWAKLADVDIEPGLQELIDKRYSQGIEDEVLDPGNRDYNAEDNTFDVRSDFSQFLGNNASFTATDRELEGNGYGNPVIWMIGEKYDGSRPEFKESAFEVFVDAFLRQISFVFDGLWDEEL